MQCNALHCIDKDDADLAGGGLRRLLLWLRQAMKTPTTGAGRAALLRTVQRSRAAQDCILSSATFYRQRGLRFSRAGAFSSIFGHKARWHTLRSNDGPGAAGMDFCEARRGGRLLAELDNQQEASKSMLTPRHEGCPLKLQPSFGPQHIITLKLETYDDHIEIDREIDAKNKGDNSAEVTQFSSRVVFLNVGCSGSENVTSKRVKKKKKKKKKLLELAGHIH